MTPTIGKYRLRLTALLWAGIFMGVAAATQARSEPPGGNAAPAAAPQPPVHITADQAEYFNQENRVVFLGNVVATQGDATLTAERMEVVFTPPPEKGEGKKRPLTEPQTSIRTITATEKVSFRQVDPESKKERYGVGERGDYDAEARTMTLTGNPRVWEGKNVMTGERMVFFLDNHRFKAEGKVNLTVYPEETKPPEKKNPEKDPILERGKDQDRLP